MVLVWMEWNCFMNVARPMTRGVISNPPFFRGILHSTNAKVAIGKRKKERESKRGKGLKYSLQRWLL